MKTLKPVTWLALFYSASLLMTVIVLWKSQTHGLSLQGRTPMIAIVSVEGPIRMGDSLGSATNPRDLIKTLQKIEDNPRIRAVVIRINSPGGSVAAVQEIYGELNRLKSKGVILVTSMGDVAASGGYYLAAATNRIVANPGTLTGSIGVILELANAEELLRKVGVRMETVKSGKFKDAGSPFRPLTAEEQRWFQGLIDQAYEQFVTAVCTGRHLSRKELAPLADGRVFTGELAKEKKLVDVLGSEYDAIQEAKKLLGIPVDEKVPVQDMEAQSPLDRWLHLAGSAVPFNLKLTRPTQRFEYMWE